MDRLQFRVCNMNKKDVPQVLSILKAEGWNTGNDSVYSWLEVDPDGFKVAKTGSEKVLGVCCAIRNHENFYFIGYYIVRKEYRGMGIGTSLWNACMIHIGNKNYGLNAMPRTIELYSSKCNFSIVEDQWYVMCNSTTEDIIHQDNLSDAIPESVSIISFSESLLPIIFKYDYDICGYNRELTLKLNCNEKDSTTMIAFKHRVCVGFGTVKISIQDIPHVSPLYADDASVAETMLRRLLASCTVKKGFSMKTFSSNQAANNLIKKIGCPLNYKLTRMYKDRPDSGDSSQRVYAVLDTNCSPI